MSCAESEIPPDACATEGSARICASSDSGTDGVVEFGPLLSPPIALLPLTTASEFLLAWVKTVENADWIVSVRM